MYRIQKMTVKKKHHEVQTENEVLTDSKEC